MYTLEGVGVGKLKNRCSKNYKSNKNSSMVLELKKP